MRLHIKSLIIFLLLFITELLIAQTSGFIRYTFGDYLVVILLYYLLKTFFNFPPKTIAIAVLLFSYIVETLQYFNFVNLIGLGNSKTANIIIGNTFSIGDLIAYTLGIITVYCIEKKLGEKNH
ncbi:MULTISPECIES: DUF2809 domain-containing protein [unclassified Tenacibaculum]|uniref:ribosomal maturation YjgA family protein n=1 Tax=unclassified Tenacibaculum TaxID=2635139 RepID=UPI001F1AF5DC|nr:MULTISPECIES: DUF2809 domain-containing protein [unclassified Tenacibaculum]MCF2873340.1 DUF2809 domain-containing protein [Tenacibaculum sp. Cn5-1]MCF2933496.1 DUF2809 domain-containing protein [Tenacibaculum sp. Cn5-34]MCG7509922.1 DUF2809 domain-containing protein [Tenacibaculum sp. Cn5-46]